MVKVLRKLREVAEQNTRKIPECFLKALYHILTAKTTALPQGGTVM